LFCIEILNKRKPFVDTIKFGTDGWRARTADTYTFPNVRRVAYGLGKVLKRKRKSALVFVGYDGRFFSDKFALVAAEVLASLGHRPVLSSGILSTPALSLAVKNQKADAGVMITASHNSAAYNGFKIKLPPGVSAPPDFTRQVEKNIPAQPPALEKKPRLQTRDWVPLYLNAVKSQVNLAALRRAGLTVAVDSMHGTGFRHFERMVSGGRTRVTTIAGERDVFFGNRQPEPIGQNLKPLSDAVRKLKARVGFATDGDGDRVGMVDEKGQYVDVHKVHALLLYHLWVHQGRRGGVVKTVSGTLMLDRMARKWGIPLFETPVGFKHIGGVMLKEDILLGMEESGGIAFKGHLAERDGLLSALLLMETLVAFKMSVTGAIAFLQKEFGPYYSDRVDLENVSFERQKRIIESLKKSPPPQMAGFPVVGVNDLDGVKLKLKNGWVLVRASGTEPLLRLYAEASSRRDVQRLLDAACRETQRV
jgi:phosphomannomutase